MIAIDNSQSLYSLYGGGENRLASAAFSWALGGIPLTAAGTVTFAAPASGVTATGTPILENGAIVGVTITNPGSGYTAPPVATFSAANVTGVSVLSGATVGSVNITAAGGRTFTVTDNTTYPTGDSRAAALFGIYDKFGHKDRFAITSGNTAMVYLGTKRLTIGESGFAAEVTVTTVQRRIKDGSSHNIGFLDAGTFQMEK